jgi:NADH-quinone oxidoreductase subunit N
MSFEQFSATASSIVPEIVLVAVASLYFLVGPFLSSDDPRHNLRNGWGLLALGAFALSGWIAYQGAGAQPADASSLPFVVDNLTSFIRAIMLTGGAVLLLIAWNQVDDEHAAEHHACLLLIIAGVNLVVAANDLVALFLALELVSIPTYILLYLAQRSAPANEATIKYFLLSVFSSAVVLYGLSFLFGATGTTNLASAAHVFAAKQAAAPMPLFLKLALVAVIAGLGFRIALVPFHFYVPDVFQGAPISGVALLAFVPKVAGLAALLRLLDSLNGASTTATLWGLWTTAAPLLAVLAALTMVVGSVMALVQTNLRRLLAWSSIAHAGFLLVGLCTGPGDASGLVPGVDALLFYLVVYGATAVGLLAVLAGLERCEPRVQTLDDVAGLGRTHPVAALAMTVFLFSLAGLPPTAGFFGKLNLFIAAWSAGTPLLQIVAALMLLSAAIGAGYYLRLVAIMYLREPAAGTHGRLEFAACSAAFVCAVVTLGGFFVPSWLWQAVERIIA